jgi:hypothetical protein
MKTLTLISFTLLLVQFCSAQISADSAKYYVGKNVEVCGKVMRVSKNFHTKPPSPIVASSETVLNFGSKKNISFMINIPDAVEAPYQDEKKKYLDSTVCVSGIITLTTMPGYGHGIPTISAESSDQIKFR